MLIPRFNKLLYNIARVCNPCEIAFGIIFLACSTNLICKPGYSAEKMLKAAVYSLLSGFLDTLFRCTKRDALVQSHGRVFVEEQRLKARVWSCSERTIARLWGLQRSRYSHTWHYIEIKLVISMPVHLRMQGKGDRCAFIRWHKSTLVFYPADQRPSHQIPSERVARDRRREPLENSTNGVDRWK